MIPKKIYLNYVDENGSDKTWSEEPISVCDCDMQNREYVDLSQVWHDASEMPNNHSYIMLMIDRYTIKTDYIPACLKHCQLNDSNWNEFVKDVNIKQWAYIEDLLPKGDQ